STSCTNTPSLSKCGATSTDITSFVRSMSLPLLVSSNIGVTTTWLKASTTVVSGKTTTSWATCTGAGCTADPGNEVQVQVTYALPLIIKFWNTSTKKFAANRSTWNISS